MLSSLVHYPYIQLLIINMIHYLQKFVLMKHISLNNYFKLDFGVSIPMNIILKGGSQIINRLNSCDIIINDVVCPKVTSFMTCIL